MISVTKTKQLVTKVLRNMRFWNLQLAKALQKLMYCLKWATNKGWTSTLQMLSKDTTTALLLSLPKHLQVQVRSFFILPLEE